MLSAKAHFRMNTTGRLLRGKYDETLAYTHTCADKKVIKNEHLKAVFSTVSPQEESVHPLCIVTYRLNDSSSGLYRIRNRNWSLFRVSQRHLITSVF